jgi:hypothetical protein
MTISNREISFYVDTMIVESIMRDDAFNKKATDGRLTSLMDQVKSYVGNQIDPNDKAGSLMNILGPGAIFTTFKALNLGWLGLLLSLSMRVFHIDVSRMIKSIWNKLGDLIKGDKQVTSAQVDSIVQGVAQEHMTPVTKEDEAAAHKLLTKSNYDELMHDVNIIKLTMVSYATGSLKKEAAFFDWLTGKKKNTTNILARVLGWTLKVGLSAAGLMVAGDVVNKFLDRPNAFDGSYQQGKEVGRPSELSNAPVNPATTQTKFKLKSSYRPENLNINMPWTVGITNTVSNINSMLTQFTKDVYDGLDGKESLITSTAGFRAVADRIAFYNRSSLNSPSVWIPSEFKSKKQMVDYFIDDVAEKSV